VRLAPKAWRRSADYKSYLQTQLRRTLLKKSAPLPDRARILIDKIDTFTDLSNSDVLCIGSRNTAEIDYFYQKGAKHVTGIDLYSENEAILVMDMHDMVFPDKSFDVIYSCHSLEHAFDVQKVINEIVRVARSNAIVTIEVPVAYATQGADLVDFGNLNTLHCYFQPHIAQILWSDRQPPYSLTNNGGNSIIRTIFRIMGQ
jgi:SAM-dependent methyltransferase